MKRWLAWTLWVPRRFILSPLATFLELIPALFFYLYTAVSLAVGGALIGVGSRRRPPLAQAAAYVVQVLRWALWGFLLWLAFTLYFGIYDRETMLNAWRETYRGWWRRARAAQA